MRETSINVKTEAGNRYWCARQCLHPQVCGFILPLRVEKGRGEISSCVPGAVLDATLLSNNALNACWDCESGMSQTGWVLAWRAAPDSANSRRETSQVEMLVSHRGMVVSLRAETGERREVPKSVRDLGCCSLQGASEMQVGQGDGRVCPKSRVGGAEGEGLR